MSFDAELRRIYDDLYKAANALDESITGGIAWLDKLEKLKVDVDEALSLARRIKSRANNPDMTDIVVTSLSYVMRSGPLVLKRNAKKAAESSSEYSREPFPSLLEKACEDENIFKYKVNHQGWSTTITVNIDLDESAGTLEDWGRAVVAARTANSWNKQKDPIKASAFWKHAIFNKSGVVGKRGKLLKQAGNWRTTIDARLGFVEKPAPFWKLLDNGNFIGIPGSDRGGLAYPKNAATHFVKNTEEELERRFIENMADAFNDYEHRVKFATLWVTSFTKLKKFVDSIEPPPDNGGPIREVEFDDLPDYEDYFKRKENELEDLIDNVVETLGLDPSYTGNTRLVRAILNYKEYGTFVDINVTKAERIEVTEGAGRKRVSARKLISAITGSL